MRLILVTLTLLLMCAAARAADRDDKLRPEPGISRDLARWRAEHYKNIRYALNVHLKPGAEMLTGDVTISLTLDNPSEDLVLDWRMTKKETNPRERVSQITANGKQVSEGRFTNDHIVIPSSYLVSGENVLRLAFESPISTSGSAVTRYRDREDNSEYVYTLFVPSDASTAFPCFDQPDLKARFRLSVSAPADWKVVSNTGAETVTRDGTRSDWQFNETQPISTYVFAFTAGPFAEFKDESSPYGTTLFVRKSKAERARRELPEVFRLNREGLKFFEEYFAHKFPFTKCDLVVIPEFPFNGMEHAGAIFLREEGVLFPSDPTSTDLALRAELILHEAAHQWFGDLVTMRWFDDLWLKEGFATFMAYKAAAELMPGQDAWKVFHLRTKPLAYLTDVTKGTTPIWQEIQNLSAAKSAYGNIVYRKAPSILRQAEFYLGADAFRRAIQLLVKEHAYSNAEWADLVRAFERTSGRKLDAWADAWVKRRGLADVRVDWSADRRGRISRFTVEQRDALGEGGLWPMRVKILLGYKGAGGKSAIVQPTVLTVELKGAAGPQSVAGAIGKPRPDYVFANYEDYGYGRFPLDVQSRRGVVENWASVPDDFTRTLLWGSLWESVREAEVSPLDYIELALAQAERERDDTGLQAVLARVQTAYTRYLSDDQRRTVAPRLEAWLATRMMMAENPGLRITFYRTFREVASTPESLDKLRQILLGTLQVPGMTLRSRDRFDIVRTLIANGDPRAGALLKKLSDDDKTDDGRRYAFAAAAAEPSAEVKKRYFDRFLRDAELAESWIEAAFVPFNAPRQSSLTLPYLEPSLRELPNLKRTRKIFFVNGWLAAFIGGQCSPEALKTVNDFLNREQALDRDLRLKVLEAADGLERCVRIRAKYAGEVQVTVRPRT